MTVLFCVSFQVTHSRAENNIQLYSIKANHTHVRGREKNIRGGYILGYMKSVRILFHSTFLSVTAKTSTFVFLGGYVVILLQFHTSYQRLGSTKGRRERGRPFLHPYHLFCPVSHFISPLYSAEPSFFPTLGLSNRYVFSFRDLKHAAVQFHAN